MDVIFLHELKLEIFIGVYEWERQVPQLVQFDLEIELPKGRRYDNDRIDDTIDYAKVIDYINDTLQTKRFYLIETLAEYLAQGILENFLAPRTKVSITKLGVVAGAKRIGVTLERSREAYSQP